MLYFLDIVGIRSTDVNYLILHLQERYGLLSIEFCKKMPNITYRTLIRIHTNRRMHVEIMDKNSLTLVSEVWILLIWENPVFY